MLNAFPGSSPCSQPNSTCPCHEPHQSVHTLQSNSLPIHFNSIFPSTPRVSRLSLSSPFSSQILEYISLRATCPVYLILSCITLTVFQSTPLSLQCSLFPCHSSLLRTRLAQFNSHSLSVHPKCITFALAGALRTRFITQFASL